MTDPIQTTWATAADVSGLTGVTVSDAELTMAAGTIDLIAVRLYEDKDRIGTRDQMWLRKAVAYQAAWLQANPDVFQRVLIASDGSGASSTQYGPDGLTLAPFAQHALKRVSWLRSRSLHVRGAGEWVGRFGGDEPEDAEPGWGPWRPVGD